MIILDLNRSTISNRMSESVAKISEQVEILYDELLKFKHDNTCSDCGVAVGINFGGRKTCTECNAIFCPKYNKGGYSYKTYTRYVCRECYKKIESIVNKN